MPDVQTDSVTITVDIRQHGNITIDQGTLTYPSFAFLNESFDISFNINNSGDEDAYYSEVLDGATQKDRVIGTIGSGATESITHTVSIDYTGNVSLVINVGYVTS